LREAEALSGKVKLREGHIRERVGHWEYIDMHT
jgi:hypothetical protein